MTERERLIKLIGDSEALQYSGCHYNELDYCCKQIADYLLDSGVIVPPCKAGDIVYVIYDGYVAGARVLSYLIDHSGGLVDLLVTSKKGITFIAPDYPVENIFLTCEEAEKALKEGAE